jgi:hypothetical protein
MRPERWQQIDQLFEAALERQSEERVAFSFPVNPMAPRRSLSSL